ncbi:hypothetical protein BTO30_09430 [Domibacillus antri]|uniref:Uncharacterized protein n=1 Tax=Domibacillus antri TaxID=1714264 RepID=A0A1Q8Q589_9BACI|nr:hypothetical protein BTO30_09430 [Domibacillus antri]
MNSFYHDFANMEFVDTSLAGIEKAETELADKGFFIQMEIWLIWLAEVCICLGRNLSISNIVIIGLFMLRIKMPLFIFGELLYTRFNILHVTRPPPD